MSGNFDIPIDAPYQLSYRIGGVLPLYAKKELDTLHPAWLLFTVLSNFLLRSFTYPLVFSFILFSAITSSGIATIYNIGFLLNKFFSVSDEYTIGKYNQAAIKHCLWVISDLICFLLDQAKLFIGLFSSKIAVDTLTDLAQQIDRLPNDILSESRDAPYLGQVIRLGAFIQNLGFRETGMAIAALLSEPVSAIASGIRMQRSLEVYSVNPTALSETQRSQIPVLLIHGDQHNDTAFIPLLDKLSQEKYEGPIFTVNIPDMQNEAVRNQLIDAKIHEIDRLYSYQKRENENHIRCFCIGHSSGADALVELKERDDTTKRMLVLVGAVKHVPEQPEKASSIVYFNAEIDVVLSMPSEEKHKDSIEARGEVHSINTGHLGLLSHQKVLQRCYELLVSNDTKTFFSSTLRKISDNEPVRNKQPLPAFSAD